ncbi:MAG: Zn-dependent hydrolase [Paracoccus sp. (in: a-proteobacteria)]|nr:Zn-dependent hydrolase [Paracoccus sp. (in: a-proteobacteria)]
MSTGIDGPRLIARLHEMGALGRDDQGRLCRLAASDADKAGRDLFCGWLRAAGLAVEIDRIGNIYGIWTPPGAAGDPLLIGSHIDSVIDAGIYDGCYGTLAGLAVIEAMQALPPPSRPLAVVAFTNEEGVRFQPDMMGSLVAAGGMAVDEALDATDDKGLRLGDELRRIGYAGRRDPGFLRPHAYLELHIEQGPILEHEGLQIGVVDSLQGISWQDIRIEGRANHAGTTPMEGRLDAGVAAARLIAFLDDLARRTPGGVATVGRLVLHPAAINVIPGAAHLTLDMRNPDEALLQAQEAATADFLNALRGAGFSVTTRPVARFQPVRFDTHLVATLESAALARGLGWRRMSSGAGHDAQMMARIAPSAMIFVPSRGGISHNPAEFTDQAALIAGADLLLDAARKSSA